ncbi:MAG TPA: hypothetical protein VGV69_02855 [Solirubrobacterales bacterium]|nr:hypothetical protein [Solirubrobacterales bacterium]
MSEFADFLLPAAPLLCLLAALLFGRYPGCEAIVRISERIAGLSRAGQRAARGALPKPPRSFAPGGGLLIALGLAQRPPPLAA